MRTSHRVPAVLLAGLLASACSRPATPPPQPATASPDQASAGSTAGPAATPTAGSTASPPPPPEGARLPVPVAPPPVEVLEAQALIPGAATALRQGELITVDPGATFRVVLKGGFPEARLSLLDGADAMLPSAGAREAGPNTTVTLQPTAPLKPGSDYRLRVDGAGTRELMARDGTLRAPVEFPLLAAGEAQPEPKSRSKRPKKRN